MFILSTFWDVLWASFLFFFIFVPLIMLWVFALVDLFRRKGMSVIARVLWLLFIIFVPIIGPLIYLLVRPADEEVEYRY